MSLSALGGMGCSVNWVAKEQRSSEGVGERVNVLRFISFNVLMHDVSYFLFLYHHGAGVATPDPGEAPPMAVVSVFRWLLILLLIVLMLSSFYCDFYDYQNS